MATTAIEINPEAVAVEFSQRRVQELTDVITSHSFRFRRIAFGHLGNAADAEDAVQDALLSALTHVDQFKGRAKMSTWLTTIVINSARMKLRRRLSQVQIALDETGGEQTVCVTETVADTRPDPEAMYRKQEIAQTIAHATSRLSPTLRRTFELRDLEGEHSRNGKSPSSTRGNGKSTARQSSCEAQGSDQEGLPGRREATQVQSPTGIHGDRARRRCYPLTDILEDESFLFIKELLVDSSIRSSANMISAIVNCICPECGGAIELGLKQFKCVGRCGKDWRPIWDREHCNGGTQTRRRDSDRQFRNSRR